MKHNALTHFSLLPALAAALAGCGGQQASNVQPGAAAAQAASTDSSAPKSAQAAADGAVLSGSGYKITAAKGWKDGAAAAPKTVDLVIAAAPKEQFAANLNVVVVPATPGETLQAAKKQLPIVYPRSFTQYVQLKQGDITVDGTPGMTNTANHTAGSPPHTLWMHQAFFIKGGKVYTLTCTALDSNHAEYEADFNAMIQSLKWN
jgi:hypothetical protein